VTIDQCLHWCRLNNLPVEDYALTGSHVFIELVNWDSHRTVFFQPLNKHYEILLCWPGEYGDIDALPICEESLEKVLQFLNEH